MILVIATVTQKNMGIINIFTANPAPKILFDFFFFFACGVLGNFGILGGLGSLGGLDTLDGLGILDTQRLDNLDAPYREQALE